MIPLINSNIIKEKRKIGTLIKFYYREKRWNERKKHITHHII